MDLQDTRIGEPPSQGVAHPGRVGAGLFRQHQRLGDGADVEADDDLIGGLGHLSGAGGADVGCRLAENVKHELGLFHGRVGPAGHDRQRAALGPDGAAGNRGVDVIAAGRLDVPGKCACGDDLGGAHVDDQTSRLKPADHPVRTPQHLFHRRRVGQHEDDRLRRAGGVGGGLGRGHAFA